MNLHPYMAEQLASMRHSELIEEAANARLRRRDPSWLRRLRTALRQSLRRSGGSGAGGRAPRTRPATDVAVID